MQGLSCGLYLAPKTIIYMLCFALPHTEPGSLGTGQGL